MTSHSETEWNLYRPLIEHLYLVESHTMVQVCDFLCGLGFRVK